MSNKHRKIYEQNFGPIPKDQDGRSYEIHHIDGNHSNNNPSNLKAVTIQEHYDIHYAQGDYGACWLIAKSMCLSPSEIKHLAKLNHDKRIKDGTHPFLGGKVQSETAKRRISSGEHHFTDSEWQSNINLNRIKKGEHNWLGSSMNEKMLREGKHPSQNKVTCEMCGKTLARSMYIRWKHGKNCNASI